MTGDVDQNLTDQYNTAKRSRAFVRANVTKLSTKVMHSIDSLTEAQKLLYLEKFEGYKSNLLKADALLLDLATQLNLTEADINHLSADDEEYEELICARVTSLTELNCNTSVLNSSNPSADKAKGRLKLPEVQLPTYSSSKGENLHSFFETFEAIVPDDDYTSYQKFILLRKQLLGSPLVLVDAMHISQHNYDKAKEMLLEAFASDDVMKYKTIQQLSQLNMSRNSDPYVYIGQLKTIMANFESLKIECKDIIQYFAWNGLNKEFQSHITQITNKHRPSLDQINDTIFEATSRYLSQKATSNAMDDRKSTSKTASAFAANVSRPNKSPERKGSYESSPSHGSQSPGKDYKQSKPYCALCAHDKTDHKHYMRSCPIYVNPKSKFNKLRNMNACTRCSFKNHARKDCKFEFKTPCRICQGDHMSYLCFKVPDTNANVSTNDDSDEISSVTNMSFVKMSGTSDIDQIVLPTVSAHIKNNKQNVEIRALIDSGSQLTYICSELADSLKLPVVEENIPLVVHGFNSSRKFKTKSVKMNINIGGVMYSHVAVCIDRIRTNFSVQGIESVVDSMAKKGYDIADKNYKLGMKEHIGNIDVILGSDADHMITMNSVVFGDSSRPESNSCFYNTECGVVLSGRVQNMVKNIPFLPPAVRYPVPKARAAPPGHGGLRGQG